MRLVLTLLAKNEADVIDANVAYHLAGGVDSVVATDNGSTDGTLEILERYERLGVLRLIREPSTEFRQGEWVTRMARIAAEEGADWVINSDADEFWWPRGGDFKEALGAYPDATESYTGSGVHLFRARRAVVRSSRNALPSASHCKRRSMTLRARSGRRASQPIVRTPRCGFVTATMTWKVPRS